MDMRILEDTPEKRELFGYDEMTGESVIRTEWKNAGAVLDRNKAVQGKDAGKSKSGEFHFVGSIPLGLVQKWKEEEGIDAFNPDHWPAIARKLDSNEYTSLRINTGRVGIKKKMW